MFTKMKFKLFIVGMALLGCGVPTVQAEGHGIWITPFGGYRTAGSIKLDDPNYSKVDLIDTPIYGLAAGMEVIGGLVEVMWTHQDSEAQLVRTPGSTAPLDQFTLNTDQFHVNGLYFPPDFVRVQPYVLGGLGVTHYNPTGEASSESRFSWALGGGAHIPVTERIGFRFEAKWNPALTGSSGNIFCNSGTGRCYAAASGDIIDQFDFTAGLTLRI
jgi:hypothetical protein